MFGHNHAKCEKKCLSTFSDHDSIKNWGEPQPSIPSSRIPCTKLQVEHGHVSPDKVEEGVTVLATIFCDEGFILVGKDTLSCTKSGKWDGDVPKCISK